MSCECEGSCPCCLLGEVENHKCNRCRREYCEKCHGIKLGMSCPDIGDCNCGNKSNGQKFDIGQKVRFAGTDFLKTYYGHYNFVKIALINNEVFNVVAVFEYEGDQFVIVKNQLGYLRIGPWGTNLFVRVD